MPSLTDKQERFVQEYLVDNNATAAAERAGYSSPSYGRKLYTKPHVKAAIAEARSERKERTQIKQDWVLEKLKENVERAMQEREVKDKDGVGIGEYQYEGNVANRALQLLGKHLGMFVERHEVSGPDGEPIQHQWGPPREDANDE